VAIVPRPQLDLSGVGVKRAYAQTLQAISAYRENVRLAACLTQKKVPVAAALPAGGVAQIGYDHAKADAVGCARSSSTMGELAADTKAVYGCRGLTDVDSGGMLVPLDGNASPAAAGGASVSPGMQRCLELAFQRRVAADAAVTLLLYVGVRGETGLRVDAGRLLGAAIPIVLLAIGCGVLLSRHVLRPVDAVIRASRRLESGHRAARVPERGRDEMAALARAFNRMADSVQRGDDQQRQMVADIAHELRTPLANIRGYLEALKDGVLAPNAEVFESLHEEALLQQRTIDDLQDLALADQQRLIDHRVRIDVGEVARSARAAHAARADAAQVTLVDEVEAGLHLDADPDRLRQAVGNLITNALRATGPGGRITVAARRLDATRVRLTVSDTGRGIAPEHLPHLFDRFWRADPARARKTGGSGLGLAITREIVHGHGGVIEVDSAPGAGATFIVTLPAARDAETRG
jgi:two-component system sensor histidine kinase BaeS